MNTNIFLHTLHPESQNKGCVEDILTQFDHKCEKEIKSLLRFVASEKWGVHQSCLNFIHRKDYRLRTKKMPGFITWWVEHDIPPYDLYRCEAYRVTLRIEGGKKPLIFVESDAESILLNHPSLQDLEIALRRIAKQPPLHIPRRMGVAWE